MDEIAALTPDYAGVSFERLGRQDLQWPVAPDGIDSPMLYEHVFTGPVDSAPSPHSYKAPGDQASEEFPLILVTGRRLEHYNAGTMTRRTGNRELCRATYWRCIRPTPSGSR